MQYLDFTDPQMRSQLEEHIAVAALQLITVRQFLDAYQPQELRSLGSVGIEIPGDPAQPLRAVASPSPRDGPHIRLGAQRPLHADRQDVRQVPVLPHGPMGAQKACQSLAPEHLGQGPTVLLLPGLDLLEVPQRHVARRRAVGPGDQDVLEMLARHVDHSATRQHLQHPTERGLCLVGETLLGRRARVVWRRKTAWILHPPMIPSAGRSPPAAA
ncbi:hypothetical protein OG604_49445 [Streptomyces sp. NBC_01231]|nr:hypothetical protein OG604_49445 [Streptomyces sp. NBC_01231]